MIGVLMAPIEASHEQPPGAASWCWFTVSRHESNTLEVVGGCEGNIDKGCAVYGSGVLLGMFHTN